MAPAVVGGRRRAASVRPCRPARRDRRLSRRGARLRLRARRAIVVTTGMRQSLSLFARLVLDAGDAAWIEEPGFVGTREALALADVRAVPVADRRAGLLRRARRWRWRPQARLAVVAPAHHFPLGTVLGLQRRLELLSWAERHKGWIAEDDFDGEYRYAGRPLAPLRALDRSRPRRLSRQLLQAALSGAAAELSSCCRRRSSRPRNS